MGAFQLSVLDVSIIVGSLVLVLAIGVAAARKTERTTEGYFLASGSMPWYLIGAAFVSTSVSSEQIVGTIGAVYKNGLAIANWEWWTLPTYLLTITIFIPLYLLNRIMTVPELLNKRFGPTCGMIYSCVILVGYIFVFLPPIIWGGSLTLSELTGWDQQLLMVGMLVVTGSYTLMGGLSSVMWTDAIQCVLLIGGGVLLYFLALNHIPGGWQAMVDAAPDRFHLYQPPSDPEAPFAGLIVASFGVFLFYQSSNQVMIQRITSARSNWDGLMGMVFSGFINLVRPLVTCLLGLVVYHWLEVMREGPTLLPDNQDSAFALALGAFAPSGLKGIILAGFFAAAMSTISALSNAVATIFSLDVYKRLWRKNAGDREMIITGQISGGLALLVALIIAPLAGTVGLFTYFQTGVTYMATPFISVLLLGVLWKRTSYQGAIAGLAGGLAIQLALAGSLHLLEVQLHWLYVGFIAQVLTMMLIVIVSLATPAPKVEQVITLTWDPKWLRILHAKERPWWQQVTFWGAIYAVLWCAIYIWLW